MQHFYTLDGLPLNDPQGRWTLEKGTGLRIIPARTSSGAALPGRDGVLPSLGSTFEPGAVGIRVAVLGDDYGSMLSTTEFLSGVIGQRHKLLSLVHDYGNGQKREALVEVTASTTPELVAFRNAIIDIQCSVPGSFWRDEATTDSSASITAGTTATTLTGLTGTTAPIGDALIRVKGGFSSAYVEDVVTGDRVTINTAIPASEYVVIDAAAWTARRVTSDTWSGGSNIITSVVSNRGSGPMIRFEPDFATGAGRIRVRAVGTGLTGSPQVIMRVKRSFL